ncbi:MAG: META domain-containing protein [Methanocorpusculum sp.]|nr:META domain-containing protein [Methanocorpusculum sp.]
MNKLFTAIFAAVLLCGVIISAGCISDTAGDNTGSSLTGSWAAADNPLVTLVFNTDGTYSGEAQVNLYNGTFAAKGSSLDMGEGVNRTKRAGPSDMVEAEDSYIQRLTLVSSYAVSGDTLTLSDTDGKVLLIFVRTSSAVNGDETAESLPYGTWQLEGRDKVTLTFSPDGKYSGSAPINSYGGSYSKGIPDKETQRTPLLLSNTFSTLMAGSPEDMDAEDAYYSALHSVASCSVTPADNGSPQRLELFDKDGVLLLSFTRAVETAPSTPATTAKRALPYGTWLLAEDPAVSLSFNPDGTYSGRAQVNSFSGTYLVYGPASKPFGESLEMSPAIRTKMTSADPTVNVEEKQFFDTLESANEYNLSADAAGILDLLELLDKYGSVLLTFVKEEET